LLPQFQNQSSALLFDLPPAFGGQVEAQTIQEILYLLVSGRVGMKCLLQPGDGGQVFIGQIEQG
jgi:hypothetical protein